MPGRLGPVSDDLRNVSWQEAAVPRLILAAVTPDNTPHGYNITFAAPMLAFIIIGGVLYLLFSRPHRRIPAQPVRFSASRPATGSTAAGPAGTASATATASGTETAAESAAAEPAAEAPADAAPSDAESAAESDGTAETPEETE
jgi:hypothetical protein